MLAQDDRDKVSVFVDQAIASFLASDVMGGDTHSVMNELLTTLQKDTI